MRVLITEQFNKSIIKLNEVDRKKVLSIFNEMENMSKQEIFNSRKLIKLLAFEEKIYEIKSRDIRIFCTFASENGNEDMIFLDVIRKRDNQMNPKLHRTIY